MEQVLAGSWRRIIVGAGKSWVVLSPRHMRHLQWCERRHHPKGARHHA
jgi:hypothetical protein